MKEPRLFHNQRPTAAQTPPPNPTGIRIHWSEGVGMTIQIQFRHIELRTKDGCVNLKPGCPPGHTALFALNNGAPKKIISRPERRMT
jgi:hypothetical protein